MQQPESHQPAMPHTSPFDLRAFAHQAMVEAGFQPDLPAAVNAEAHTAASTPPSGDLRDLRQLLWSSIDNEESRDLDQVEYVEQLPNDQVRVLVGIADVDALVPQGSATDHYAASNATSVYTGVVTFPMLPPWLSTDNTSLLAGEDRLAVVVEFVVAADGTISQSTAYRALLRNHAKLVYERIGAWLDGADPVPQEVANLPGLQQQMELQATVTDRLYSVRQRNGALDFETIEATPVLEGDTIVDLAVRHKNRARYLIENLMIATNGVMAELMEARQMPVIRRVVRTPERWPRIVELAAGLGEQLPTEPDGRALAEFLARRKSADPQHFPDLSLAVVKLMGAGEYTVVPAGTPDAGHFGLAVPEYTHTTAPNRRYADLITQRLLKAALAGQPLPYTITELEAIAEHCNDRDRAAKKVERLMRKVAAAGLLSGKVGQVFDAIVTGESPKGTFVRVIKPPVEGRVVQGEEHMDVGDAVRVRLLSTDPSRGFIDFAGVA